MKKKVLTEDEKYQEVLDKLDRRSSIDDIEEVLTHVWTNFSVQPSQIVVSADVYKKYFKKKKRRRKV